HPQRVDSGTDAAWYRLCARKCRRDWRKRRSLLGCALVPFLRHARTDHAKADERVIARNLRIRKLFSAVLHPRKRSRGTQTVLDSTESSLLLKFAVTPDQSVG